MDHRTETFEQHRKRLWGIAYRMLGTRADADDVVQDAWLRWNESDTDSLRSPEAWLVTVTSRLAIDRLRQLRGERERYPGFWLPEPLVESESSPTTNIRRRSVVPACAISVRCTIPPPALHGFPSLVMTGHARTSLSASRNVASAAPKVADAPSSSASASRRVRTRSHVCRSALP